MTICSVKGVASASLVTSDPELFDRSVEFYQRLGFRLAKSYSKLSSTALATASASTQSKLHVGVSNDSLREFWLESFPLQNTDSQGNLVPWQELAVYHGDGSTALNHGTVLKLRLSPASHTIKTVPNQVLAFFTTDLAKVEKALEACQVARGSSNDALAPCVRVTDPMGHSLVFTSREDVLEPKTYSSASQYLESKSQKLIRQIEKSAAKGQDEQVDIDHPQKLAKRKKIAVMTSGGDAPGMNAAVRAVVRGGIYYGCDVFAVYEGYTGLVKGGDLLKKMEWNDVRSLLSMGGTAIGTARCKEFREREGRLNACYNMVVNGIDALVVCGGDGSLTGADLFRAEWPSLLDELVSSSRLTAEQIKPFKHLTIVGMVGSIDNDMACTDTTIGAASALARITEMVDYIDATATSHSRAFVVEVMGRHCGWLGLMSGIACGADYIFIPEKPPKAHEWEDDLKRVCLRHRQQGNRKTTVIIAEGAIDDQLNPITSEDVKRVLVELGLDTRITILGHVQRGGAAVAHDRMLATLQGVDAVRAVLESTPETPSPMIGMLENKIVRKPLVDAVKLTKSVATAIADKDFEKAIKLRDSSFAEAYDQFQTISRDDDGSKVLPETKRLNIGIVHVGASSSALNAATRAAALDCLSKGHKLYAILNGFSGLIDKGEVRELTWLEVINWHNKGGSEIGTNRSLPSEDFGSVAFYLQKYQLSGLIVVGGFESFTAVHELDSNRRAYPIFNIPMVVIPATVSNNVPGTEYSLGSDTCLNQLVDYCDAVKQSASSSRRRVFVVEVQGGHSGYVASYCGLVTGAIATYTPEIKIDLRTLQEDIALLFDVFENDRGEDNNGKMIVRNEQASSVYSAELIADIIKESAKGRFETRTAIPGHVQQGFTPSSLDRVQACRFAVKSVQYIEEWNTKKYHASDLYGKNKIREHCVDIGKSSAMVIGIQGAQIAFTPVAELYDNEADVSLRKGKTVHWHELARANDMLSGRLLLRDKKRNSPT
ncbi:ATP-dependent 6-phosphofructokinase [[Candida] zeylanoides]